MIHIVPILSHKMKKEPSCCATTSTRVGNTLSMLSRWQVLRPDILLLNWLSCAGTVEPIDVTKGFKHSNTSIHHDHGNSLKSIHATGLIWWQSYVIVGLWTIIRIYIDNFSYSPPTLSLSLSLSLSHFKYTDVHLCISYIYLMLYFQPCQEKQDRQCARRYVIQRIHDSKKTGCSVVHTGCHQCQTNDSKGLGHWRYSKVWGFP